MKPTNYFILPVILLACGLSLNAYAGGSLLRITCSGEDVGAEITINGKFKGECPIDLKVLPGMLKIRVEKKVDEGHDRIYEQDIRMAEDSSKKIEAVLVTRLNAAGQLKEQQIIASLDPAVREIVQQMVVIPAGSFVMGTENEWFRAYPPHQVDIQTFSIGKTEVTQAQWRALMGSNPSHVHCEPRTVACEADNYPVETVSWNDIQEFLQKLNAMTGKQFRLPTEAEWEYAARAGTTTAYPWGDQASHEYANYGGDDYYHRKGLAQGRDQWLNSSPVGSFPPNPFGLYDMNGNVREWVQDTIHLNYNGAPNDGKAWMGGDSTGHIQRGGDWSSTPNLMYTVSRIWRTSSEKFADNGFRLARTLP